jgi:hypothetical protein
LQQAPAIAIIARPAVERRSEASQPAPTGSRADVLPINCR